MKYPINSPLTGSSDVKLLSLFVMLFPFILFSVELVLCVRYVFGDVHLGQSCRLKNASSDVLLHYV